MKKAALIRLCALLTLILTFFSACSAGATVLNYENGAYRDKSGETVLHLAPFCYRAASIEPNQVYAVIKGFKKDRDIKLYSIQGADRELYLADDLFNLYYSDGAKLPTLREMNVEYIALSDQNAVSQEVGRIEKQAEILDVVDTYERGTTVPAGEVIISPVKRFELLFYSKDYPGLVYVLEYWKFDSEVLVYAPLNPDGSTPQDLYPGIKVTVETASNGQREAAFHLGTGLVYDRFQDCFYSMGDVLESYFKGSAA